MIQLPQGESDFLIREFWSTVRQKLIACKQRSEQQADSGIGYYRLVIKQHGVGDLVYHQGIEQATEAVNALIDEGQPRM